VGGDSDHRECVEQLVEPEHAGQGSGRVRA
jgi:hypothetical protein